MGRVAATQDVEGLELEPGETLKSSLSLADGVSLVLTSQRIALAGRQKQSVPLAALSRFRVSVGKSLTFELYAGDDSWTVNAASERVPVDELTLFARHLCDIAPPKTVVEVRPAPLTLSLGGKLLSGLVLACLGCGFVWGLFSWGMNRQVYDVPKKDASAPQARFSSKGLPTSELVGAAGRINVGTKLYTRDGAFYGTVVNPVEHNASGEECVAVNVSGGGVNLLPRQAIRAPGVWFTNR